MHLLTILLALVALSHAHENENTVFEEFQKHDHDVKYEKPQFHYQTDKESMKEANLDRHLEEHLAEEGYLNTAEMSESEKQYHFFRSHDYDKDDELDGTEVMQAFFHGEDVPIYDEEELATKIDYLLENYDSDRNGKLNFAEFMISSARFTRESSM